MLNGFSFDKVMQEDMPKMFRMSDDMHRMTNYLNDMRILFAILTATGFFGALFFGIVKCYLLKRKNRQRRRQYGLDDELDRSLGNGTRNWVPRFSPRSAVPLGENGEGPPPEKQRFLTSDLPLSVDCQTAVVHEKPQRASGYRMV